MSWDVVYLLFLMGCMGLAGRDAWLDRTPRKAFEWRRPNLEWWAERRTRRERLHWVDLQLLIRPARRRR